MNSSLIDPAGKINHFCKLMHLASKLYYANPENANTKSMDISDEDVIQLLGALHRNSVNYLLVGGMAGVFHGHIRTTQDLDIWVQASPGNRKKLIAALTESGVAGAGRLQNTQFVFGYTTLRFGNGKFDLDVGDDLMLYKQADFETCYARAAHGKINNIPIQVLQLKDLILEKEKTGRLKDMADAEVLRSIENKKNRSGRGV